MGLLDRFRRRRNSLRDEDIASSQTTVYPLYGAGLLSTQDSDEDVSGNDDATVGDVGDDYSSGSDSGSDYSGGSDSGGGFDGGGGGDGGGSGS